jgi:hypothetical protein
VSSSEPAPCRPYRGCGRRPARRRQLRCRSLAGSGEGDRVAAADGSAVEHRGVDADVDPVVLGRVRRIPESLGRSPCGRVIITQRAHGSVMASRTSSPMATVRPTLRGVPHPARRAVGAGSAWHPPAGSSASARSHSRPRDNGHAGCRCPCRPAGSFNRDGSRGWCGSVACPGQHSVLAVYLRLSQPSLAATEASARCRACASGVRLVFRYAKGRCRAAHDCRAVGY